MFKVIKEALAVCLSVICVDYEGSSIYEVPADQAKYIMGK